MHSRSVKICVQLEHSHCLGKVQGTVKVAISSAQPDQEAAHLSEHTTIWQAVGSAERRVWRAGATPFPRRLGSAEQSPGNTAPAPSRLGASSRGPVPMTESARRIAEALDSMAKVGHFVTVPLLCERAAAALSQWLVSVIAHSCGIMFAAGMCLYILLQCGLEAAKWSVVHGVHWQCAHAGSSHDGNPSPCKAWAPTHRLPGRVPCR